jgi:hypothetical protein
LGASRNKGVFEVFAVKMEVQSWEELDWMSQPSFEMRTLCLPREVGRQMDFQNLRLGFCFLSFSKPKKKKKIYGVIIFYPINYYNDLASHKLPIIDPIKLLSYDKKLNSVS